MMTVGVVGGKLVGPASGMPEGYVGSNKEPGVVVLRVFQCQFPIDQFFM